MKKQSFRITVRLNAEVESGNKPYLTEARVKKQIAKFLSTRSITEGLPCHGVSEITVTDVIEDSK